MKAVYEKETLNQREVELDTEIVINSFPKPVFEKSEKDERFEETAPELFINQFPNAAYSEEDKISENILSGDDTIFF